MQRGSDRLGPRRDEEMKHELEGRLRSGHRTRAEEWHDPEPDAEDDPQVPAGPAPGGENQALRSDLARYLGRTPFPARRADLLRTLGERHAPDPLVDQVRELPPRDTYRNVQDVMVALGRPPVE
ncbi:DUF2795 domain-containing protein [Streptomyces sp. B6B3]|uniref:DUF2795 domain-containing protein n=1 Tax=Streptomyces sp. B6B3 TaxID=3153570 RepID=UPI00325D767E